MKFDIQKFMGAMATGIGLVIGVCIGLALLPLAGEVAAKLVH